MLEGLSATLNNVATASSGLSTSVTTIAGSTNTIGIALGLIKPATPVTQPTTAPASQPTAQGFDVTAFFKKNMTMIYIIIGVMAVILIASKLFAKAG